MDKAYLVLSDGTVYEGTGFGTETSGVGELVFTTGMVGYLETLTDPSYAGQIILQTFPLIGNYGVIPSDFESKLNEAAKPKNGSIRLAEKAADIDDGFILSYGLISENCSFRAIIESEKDEIRDTAARALFR